MLRWASEIRGRGACHHPDGAVRFVESALRVFAEDIDWHRDGRCDAVPAGLPLGGPTRGRGAAPMSARLRVNPITCEAHGLCAELLPELIRLDDWGYPILDESEVPPDLLGLARRAVDAVPDARAAARRGLEVPSAGRAAPRGSLADTWRGAELADGAAKGFGPRPAQRVDRGRAWSSSPRRRGRAATTRRPTSFQLEADPR